MFEKLGKWFGFGGADALPAVTRDAPPMPLLHGVTVTMEREALAGPSKELPVQPPPKAPSRVQSFPSYLRSTRQSDAILPQDDRRLAQKDITAYRTGISTDQVIRDFAAASPDMAAAVFAYLRTAITGGYTAVAKNPDGSFNREATQLLSQIIARMNLLPNYADGFGTVWSLRSISESWAKELIYYGACAGELVLDKARTPYRIQPLSKTNIKFKDDKGTLKPVQQLAGEEIDLDIPTFHYVALDQDLLTAYSSSMLEPGIKAVVSSEDFAQDLQRIIKRAIHPRLKVTIDEEKFRKNIPHDIAHDPAKVVDHLNALISSIETRINGMKPEEAMVYFDAIDVDYLNNGNISLSQEYTALTEIQNARVATGVKTLPSVLGHGSGSQNVASTESMLFIKNVAGAVQEKLNEMYSRTFTLAVRLFGQDVVVEFRYDEINLRPDLELESFKAVRQSRVLEQLSLGLLTDEEAAVMLTGHLPPPSMKPLSGTMFFKGAAAPGATGAGEGDTAGKGDSNSGSALNQNLNDTPPKNPKSQNGGKKGAEVIPLLNS